MVGAELLPGLQRRLRRRQLDALLVSRPENRFYLSGYDGEDCGITESAGFLLVPARGHDFLLLTDFRYQQQAQEQARGWQVVLHQRGLAALLARVLPKLGVKRLGFESHYFLHSSHQQMRAALAGDAVELVPTTGLIERLRRCKQQWELDRIAASVALNEQVFQAVYPRLRPGMTERQVARQLENAMYELGAQGPSFATIVASGPNAALPHAVPSNRQLRTGEPIIIDMGLRLAGYCSDMTRTVVLGTPDAQTVAVARLVRKAQLAAMAAIRAGVVANKVDRAARSIIRQGGHGRAFGHALGHGVGLAVHEEPSLSGRNHQKLAAGMVVTVEPGIYLPGWGGVRLENMVVVAEDGCRLLNRDTTWLDW